MKESNKRVLATIAYKSLTEKVREKVIRYLRHCMREYFGVLATMRDYHDMLSTVNPDVAFYILDGKKLFCIVDSEEKVAEALGNNLAAAAKWNPKMMDHLLVKVIRDVDGDNRLKIK